MISMCKALGLTPRASKQNILRMSQSGSFAFQRSRVGAALHAQMRATGREALGSVIVVTSIRVAPVS